MTVHYDVNHQDIYNQLRASYHEPPGQSHTPLIGHMRFIFTQFRFFNLLFGLHAVD